MENNQLKYNWRKIAFVIGLFEFLFFTVISSFYLVFSNLPQDKLMFKNGNALWLLFIIFPFYLLTLIKLFQHNRIVDHLGVSKPNSFFKSVSTNRFLINTLLIRTSIVFLIIGLAHPIKGDKKMKTETETMELIVALDISNSMNVKDITKDNSRLDIAKRALNQLMNSFTGEKFGLCVFAGGAYPQLPITSDYPVAKLFIDEVETGMLSNQGTNIKQAFQVSERMFSQESTSKAILLITDGENHEEDPTAIIKQLKSKGIKVAVLGIGTKKGGLIPIDAKRPQLGYRLDENGNYLQSRVNPDFIKSIAVSTGGFASLTNHPFPNLTQLIKTLKKMKIVKKDDYELTVHADYYAIFVVLSLVMMLFYFTVEFKLVKAKKALLVFVVLFSSFNYFAQSWQDSVADARKLYNKGEFKKAYEKYKRIKKYVPSTVNIDEEIAQSAYKSGDYKAAQSFYEKSTQSKANKSKAQSFFNLGNSYMKSQEYQKAIEAYKNSLRLVPNDEEVRYNLSEAIRKLKQQQSKNDQNKDNQDKNNQNQQQNQQNNHQKENKDKEKNENNSSITSNTVDKILDNLQKQEEQTKKKSKEKQKGSGQANSGKDW